jgi:hypothetical protein
MQCLEWRPDAVIIDAMFLINVTPLRQHKYFKQYADLIFKQFILPYYQLGSKEVHLLFDYPNRLSFNPKCHEEFYVDGVIPKPWREYLECSQCKRAIVEILGLIYLRSIRHCLQHDQTMVLAGCFSGENQDNAWKVVGGQDLPECTTTYTSNAQEADMRIWRHVSATSQENIVIYSPDTDVYNIGLIVTHCSKQVCVQINLSSPKSRFSIITTISVREHNPTVIHSNWM